MFPMSKSKPLNQQTINMKNASVILSSIILISSMVLSCSSNSDKEKELKLKEKELILREKELALKNKELADTKDSTSKSNGTNKIDPNIKTMEMVFKEYSEGDYPNFIFQETVSKKQYNFRHISDNELGNVQVLLKDENGAFGFKANPKYLNKSFQVEAIYKTVTDYDLDGKTIEIEDWVIKSIQLAQNEAIIDKTKNVNKKTTARFINRNKTLIIVINGKEFLVKRDFGSTELIQENNAYNLASASVYGGSGWTTYEAEMKKNGDIIVNEISSFRMQGELTTESRIIYKVKFGEY